MVDAATLCAQPAAAYKVDEVVNPRCDLSEVAQVTDPPPNGRIFAALDEHRDARAAIIVYGRLPGEARRYAQDVRRWLSEMRGVNPERLLALYGGRSEEPLRLELWIVPHGAALPEVSPPEVYKSATHFDTYAYRDGESCESGHLPALKTFGEALKRRPEWQGYLIVYRRRNKGGVKSRGADWDADGYLTYREARRRAAQDRHFLARKFGLAPARIKTLIVEDEEATYAELWIVPPGAQAPQVRERNFISGR